jgi:thiol-disulfide isomerase/thioredoxin
MNARLLCLALLFAVTAGCTQSSDSPQTSAKLSRSDKEDPQKAQAQAEAPPKPPPIELKLVKYDQLTESIRAQLGKVVIVDIWASWCIPCKKEFPHLVELHQKHAKDGLVCMSVSVDDDEAKQAAALAFLKKVDATFANYCIDEPDSLWQEKWDFKGVPAVFVFDRQGRRAGKFTMDDPDHQFTYAKNIVPLVEKLLKE